MTSIKKDQANQEDLIYLADGFYLPQECGIIGTNCELTKDLDQSGGIEPNEEDVPYEQSYQIFQEKYGFNPRGKPADQVVAYLTAKAAARRNAQHGELSTKDLQTFQNLAQRLGIPESKIADERVKLIKEDNIHDRLLSAPGQKRLAELRTALEGYFYGVDETQKNYLLGELAAIENISELDRASFRVDVALSHKRFCEADIQIALERAKEFLEAGAFEQAESEFTRARGIANKQKIPSAEFEARIQEVKLTLSPRYHAELENIELALKQQPPKLNDAQSAMSFSRRFGKAIGFDRVKVEADIALARQKAADAVNKALLNE